MGTHTPGPWNVEVGGAHPCIVAPCFVGAIAVVKEQTCARFGTARHVGELLPEMKANAHLISAAPLMLAVLKVIAESPECCGMCGQAPHAADCSVLNAIAKAEGRQP